MVEVHLRAPEEEGYEETCVAHEKEVEKNSVNVVKPEVKKKK